MHLLYVLRVVVLSICVLHSKILANPTSQEFEYKSDKNRNGESLPYRWNTLTGEPTVFFAHRGETVLVPGHTLPAYEIAAIEQAEYVEPDLVLTKDGILICYHDLTLKGDTNIVKDYYDQFEDRKRSYSGIIGSVYENIVDDYFIQDFTLAEIRLLHVEQRKTGIRPHYFDTFQIPTFEEYLDVIHRMTITLNRTIGIIPELKHAAFHNQQESSNFMENQFLEVMERRGYPLKSNSPQNCEGQASINNPTKQRINCPPVIIQSFEKSTLQYLSTKTDLELMMLVDPEVTLVTFKGLEEISQFATWYCVWKEYLYVGVEADVKYRNRTYNKDEIDALGGFIPPNQFAIEAHKHNVKITLFTINDSHEPPNRGCAIVPGCEPKNKREELFYYFDMGLDGIFIESLQESRELRIIYENEKLMSNGVATNIVSLQSNSFAMVVVNLCVVIITKLIS